jgi:hypothetical protein
MELPSEYTFRGMKVPDHTMKGLHRYIKDKVPTGSFIRAVLNNDLKEAVGRADDENIQNIPAIVAFLYNCAPSNCWGSPEKVKNWLNGNNGN